MKPVEREVVFDRFVVAIGVRQSVGYEGDRDWEVYARLVSGNDVVMHQGCTRDEALVMMRYRANLATHGESLLAFVATEDDCLVSAECVARVFVDRNHRGFTCMIEDQTGKQYHVSYGSEEVCTATVYKLAANIHAYVSFMGDDNEPDDPIAEAIA